MDYTSPGDAFSSSLERSLFIRAQQERQAQQDALGQQREDRINRIQDEERQQAKDALEFQRQKFGIEQKQTRLDDFKKSLKDMLPTDIPSPDQVEESKAVGMGHVFQPNLDEVTQAMPVPQGIAAPGEAAPQGAMPAPVPQAPLPLRFIGSPDQQRDAAVTADQQKYIAGLPQGPQRSTLEGAVAMHIKPTASMAQPDGEGSGGNIGVFRVDPQRDVIQRSVKGVDGRSGWQDWSGDVPKGAHFLQQQPPKDTSAADARDAAQLQTTKEHAYTEFNNEAKPVEDQIRRIQKFTTNLGQGNNIADSTLAEQLVTLTASGTGSGVRLSQPMLDQVFKSRNKYDDLRVALRKWSVADPTDKENTSLFFTAEQKQQMVGLARAYRHAANDTLKKISEARTGIDEAKSRDEVNRLRTKAHVDIFADPADEEDAGGPAKPVTAPTRIRYDINGKVIP